MPIKLYVGNVSYRATDADLLKKFSETGKCLSAKIVLDTFTGQSKGFAFVEMATEDDAKEAIKQLNRTAMYGRVIIVCDAQPPAPRGARRGRR
jgi:RNA recognition motif-containing protein